MAKQPNPKRHKGNYRIGDRVVAINVGNLSGLKGTVIQKVGLFSTKYVVMFPGGRKSKPISGKFLTIDKT